VFLRAGSPPCTIEFIAFWNNVAVKARVWAGFRTLPRATPLTDISARVALQRCPILCTGIVSIVKNDGSFNYGSGIGWLIQTMLGNFAGIGCPCTNRSG
jgi:hypothetical protein